MKNTPKKKVIRKNKSKRLTKRKRQNLIKMKGGSLSGNQLSDLFNAQYLYDNEITHDFFPLIQIMSEYNSIFADNVNLNDKFKEIINNNKTPLYSNTFTVFVNKSILDDEIHLVAVHKGTYSTKDWANNLAIGVEKFTFKMYDQTKTKRSQTADKGTYALIEYLIGLFESSDDNNLTDVEKKIKDALKFYETKISKFTLNDIERLGNNQISVVVVMEFLRNHLSTIGHSQGAVYAYANGSIGRETIVFNPAPYNYEKPSNCTIIRIKGDPVSHGTKTSRNNNKLYVLPNETENKSLAGNHSTNTLDGIFKRFGDLFTGTQDSQDINDAVDKSDIFSVTSGESENHEDNLLKANNDYKLETETVQEINDNDLSAYLIKLKKSALTKINAVNKFKTPLNQENTHSQILKSQSQPNLNTTSTSSTTPLKSKSQSNLNASTSTNTNKKSLFQSLSNFSLFRSNSRNSSNSSK